MSLISVVVPCYNEQESLPFFLSALTDVARALQAEHDAHIETILVDDGSRDGTLALMKSASAPQTAEVYAPLTIRWITFSRNFGKEAGFKTKWLPYVNVERVAGETKWSFFSLMLYSIDGIVDFPTVPLSIASVMGILFCFAALAGVIVIVVKTLALGDPVEGWPSLACLITMLGGIQLLCLGIMGQYLAKTYLEAKRRPPYIIRESSDDCGRS